jgi:phosphoribosylformylglycinamidine synthase
MDYEKRVQTAIREMVVGGQAESAHDLGDGGLAVAVAEASFGGVGAAIRLDSDLRPEYLLFHEGPSRVLLSTAMPEQVEEIAKRHGVEVIRIGATLKGRVRIASPASTLIDCEVDHLHLPWETGLNAYVR